jgi:hypothetical protein
MGHIAIRYWGLSLGANPKRISTWKPVVNKFPALDWEDGREDF